MGCIEGQRTSLGSGAGRAATGVWGSHETWEFDLTLVTMLALAAGGSEATFRST